VDRELLLLYWQTGRDIVQRQETEGWGRGVIERLAHRRLPAKFSRDPCEN